MSLTCRKLQMILQEDKDVHTMKTRQGGVPNHYMDLRFWISLGFAHAKDYHKEPTDDELFMYASSWPDCVYDFSRCNSILIPVYWLGGYWLVILDKEGKKLYILDPRPVNEKYKSYPVGPYTKKNVCISENLMRAMGRCGWAKDIALWEPVFPNIPHEHE
uniref:Ubiquitin-like protease family profile domain-containing protein n=1 Tax=Leersia perrieri TaxID=77586 RepID=A0A0D9WNX2_9ORYZ